MTPVQEILQYISLPFKGELRDYQVEDINRGVKLKHFGLYHDMGLGKTTTSALIAAYKLLKNEHDSCLVLCPATLVTQWIEVLAKMDFAVLAYRGTPGERKKMTFDYDFIVMSYQIFHRDHQRFHDRNYYVIIDEATVMCNTQNLLYKMVNGGTSKKSKKIPGKLMPVTTITEYPSINKGSCILTGTPINKPENAYGLIKMTNPLAYRNYTHFHRTHVAKEDFFGQPEEYRDLDILKKNLLANASMRSVHDHLKLPPIIFKTVKYDLSKKHMELYRRLLDERLMTLDGKIVIDALEAQSLYNWAQKIVLNPEWVGLDEEPFGLEALDGLVESVRQYLVFCNYRMSNTKIMERYKIGGSYGEISAKDKDKYTADFKAGKLKGLACNPRSAGFGLDLPMCQHVFFGELPVTPRDLRQAIARCWRQGQQETVVVTTLVARNTIQESLFYKIMDKDDLSAEIVNVDRTLRETLNEDVQKIDSKIKIKDLIRELRGEK